MEKETTEEFMIKKKVSIPHIILGVITISLITILCINYLDAEIAVNVMHFLRTFHSMNKVTRNIPDFLPHFVIICSVFMWVIYFYRLHKKKLDVETQFLKLGGAVLPIAYLVKVLSKFVFGRTSPRSWLIHNRPLEFHWFKLWSSSFPSGHMLVFAALGMAIIIYYPKYRNLVIIFLVLLGFALIGTDYHFLSDVIAGAFLGIITTYSLRYFFEKRRIKS